ncbi:MAG: twin-arginine translocase TatA/TatE family subunit [Bacillota bacterium]
MNVIFNGLFQPTHLILILIVILIIFGPGKLPEVGKYIGKTISDFRKATNDAIDEQKKTEAQAEKA